MPPPPGPRRTSGSPGWAVPATGEAILDILFSLSNKLPQIDGVVHAPPALLIATPTPQIAEKCDRILTLKDGILN